MHWDKALTKQAVVWLARTVQKAILRLTAEDYAEHSLQARLCYLFQHAMRVVYLNILCSPWYRDIDCSTAIE